MTLIVDTAPIVAVADSRDPRRQQVRDFLLSERGPFIIPAPITAEIDYFLDKRFGPGAARGFRDDLVRGVFVVECLRSEDYADVVAVDRQYAALNLGLADLSIIVLAQRFDTRRILTFDHRHFRAVEALQGGRFALLPDDA